VALLKKRLDTQARYSLRFTVSRESARYINNISSANQQELKDSCVIVGLEEEIYSTVFMRIPLFKRGCSTGTQSHSKTILVN
jgi:hypothetical protein